MSRYISPSRHIAMNNLTRNEYIKHLQNIRRAHRIIYQNLENVVLTKAHKIVDKKLIAMKM